MVSVDLPDHVAEAVIVFDEADGFGFCGFVERVVTGNPPQAVTFVVGSELFPQQDYSALVVLVVPEVCNVPSVVRVPIYVLTVGSGVQVENGVNAVLGTEGTTPAIEVLETLILENPRVLVV